MNWKVIFLIVLIAVLIGIGAFIFMMPKTIDLNIKKLRTHIQNDTLYMKFEMVNDGLTVFADVTSYINVTIYMDSLRLAYMEIERDTLRVTPQNIEIPAKVPVQNIADLFEIEGDSVTLKIRVDVGQIFPVIGLREYEINKDIRMVKPRPPKFRLVGIESYSLKRDSVHFIPEGYLINPNPVSITVIETDLVANIDDRFTATGELDPMITIPPHDSVLVRAVIGIKDFKVIKDGLAVVFGFNPLPYTITGDMIFQFDSLEILAPIEMDVIHSGEFSLSPFAE